MNDISDYYHYFPEINHTCERALKPEAQKAIETASLVLYCLTLTLGFPGNGLVIWIAGVKMRMKRTVNTIWFLNLAIADLLCCLSVPFAVAEIVSEGHWPYGYTICKVLPTIIMLNMFASVFTLALISLDRFVQVYRPVWSQNNRKLGLAWACCTISWALAVFFSLPTFVLRETTTKTNKTFCSFDFGNVTTEECIINKGVSYRTLIVTRFVFGFSVPFLCIVCCYALVAQKISKIQNAKRAFRIMIAIVVVFFISWMPYHVVSLVDIYGKESHSRLAREVDTLVVSLAYVNSCINPILYGFMGPDFKKKIIFSLLKIFEKTFSEDATHSCESSTNPQSGPSIYSDNQPYVQTV